VGVVGDGGGYGAVASDLLGLRGLDLPVLSEATQSVLRSSLPPTAVTANPVDLAGAGEQDTFSFVRATRTLLEADGLDAVLFTAYFGGYSALSDELRERELAVADELARAARETGRPLVVHTMYWDSPPARALRAAGIPVFRAVESAVAGLAVLAADAVEHRAPIPLLPPAAPHVDGARYSEARVALAAAGVPFGEARAAHDRNAALAAAAELGYPVVLKAVGAVHKSEAGGVVLGLQNAEELAAAVERLAAAAYSVEAAEDTAAGLELLVGARRDPLRAGRRRRCGRHLRGPLSRHRGRARAGR
jgi:acyl-CoA synthetase (NDP forming)